MSENTRSVVNFINELKDFRIPMICKHDTYQNEFSYQYPEEAFYNLVHRNGTHYNLVSNLVERRNQLKALLDLYKEGDTSVYLIHVGLFYIYGRHVSDYIRNDLKESVVGKRRIDLYKSLPQLSFASNDEFIADTWYYLIREHDKEDREKNPSFYHSRLLFRPDFFSNYGRTYYDVDWVEPISNGPRNDCFTYTKETDPMTVVTNDSYIEGTIEVGPDGGGLRHFIQGKAIHAGTLIEIKFGKGWIPGRYEWSFRTGEPIRIHSGSDEILIKEGHLVRIKK